LNINNNIFFILKMACGIDACTAHKTCFIEGNCSPCNIPLVGGVLVIDSNKVTFLNGTDNLYLYEVTYPFTREDLMSLNDIDSQEPDAYVRALKKQKRSQHSSRMEKHADTVRRITYMENCEQELREELTKLKELARRHTILLQVKDREISWLKAKLNL
jgi:hypothetical protein